MTTECKRKACLLAYPRLVCQGVVAELLSFVVASVALFSVFSEVDVYLPRAMNNLCVECESL